jgi:ribosomal protein S18 acetylase RimI-like enzyme
MASSAERARFRAATADDVPALLSMMRQLYAEDGGRFELAPAERALRGLLAEPSLGAVWIAEDEDGACGYVVMTVGYSLEFHGRDAFVDELFVSRGRRGQGLGARALSLLEGECRARDAHALHLEVTPTNEPALGLYRRQGFELRGRSLMTKPIELEPRGA